MVYEEVFVLCFANNSYSHFCNGLPGKLLSLIRPFLPSVTKVEMDKPLPKKRGRKPKPKPGDPPPPTVEPKAIVVKTGPGTVVYWT